MKKKKRLEVNDEEEEGPRCALPSVSLYPTSRTPHPASEGTDLASPPAPSAPNIKLIFVY